jgi:PAS domain S-box-containing protein
LIDRGRGILLKKTKKGTDAFSSANGEKSPWLLLDECDDPMMVLGEDFSVKYANTACLRFLGRLPGDLSGLLFFELSPPEQQEKVKQMLTACLEKLNCKVKLDHDVVKPDGSAVNSVTSAVAGKPADRQTCLMLHMKDISAFRREKELAAAELEQTGEIYRKIVEASPDPIFIQTDTCFAFLNPAACTFFGVDTPEELIGKPILDRIKPENRDLVRERVRQLNVDRLPVAYMGEQEFVRVDGIPVWAETKGETIDYKGKKGALVMMRDTTAHRAAEAALNKSEHKYSVLFNQATVPSQLVRFPELDTVEVNDAWVKTLGYSWEEVIGKRSDDIGVARMTPEIEALTDEIRRNGFADNIEMNIYTKSGTELTVISNIHALELDGRQYAIITSQDITERKKAELEIFEANERYQKTFRYSAIALSLIDLNGIITSVNKKMCEIFEYTEEELLGMRFDNITCPDDIESAVSEVKRMLAGETQSVSFEKRHIRKSGEIFWAVVTAALLMDMENRPVRIIAQVQDITDRKRLEEELRARERFSRVVMDNLPIGISVNSHEPPLNFDYMNDNFPRFYRTTREALKETDVFFDAVYEEPEFRQVIRKRVLEDMQTGDPKRMRWENIPIVRAGEETRYITAYNTRVPDSDMHISIVTDETERVLALETIKNNAARLQAMHEFDLAILNGFESFNSIGEIAVRYIFDLLKPEMAGIGILGPDDRVIYIVKATGQQTVCETYDRAVTDQEFDALTALAGQPEVFPAGSCPPPIIMQLFACPGEGCTCRHIPVMSGGRLLGILNIGRASPEQFSEQEIAIIREMVTQVALAVEQKRLLNVTEHYATGLEEMVQERTAQLQAAVNELEAFTYTVSHDLRAPLRSMNGFVHILLEDYGSVLDSEGKRVCGVIADSTQQMGKLIDDLLALSRINRSSLVVMPINMTMMVKSIYNELTTEEQRSRILFSVGRLPEASVDPALIRQVWVNLLDNALKFTSKNPAPCISVEGHADDAGTVFSVTDNGVGFDMQYKDKLFGVFQRLHSVKEFVGTGVGLAIVDRIISRHGGRVWANAEVNRGATFYFSVKKETRINDTGSD